MAESFADNGFAFDCTRIESSGVGIGAIFSAAGFATGIGVVAVLRLLLVGGFGFAGADFTAGTTGDAGFAAGGGTTGTASCGKSWANTPNAHVSNADADTRIHHRRGSTTTAPRADAMNLERLRLRHEAKLARMLDQQFGDLAVAELCCMPALPADEKRRAVRLTRMMTAGI